MAVAIEATAGRSGGLASLNDHPSAIVRDRVSAETAKGSSGKEACDARLQTSPRAARPQGCRPPPRWMRHYARVQPPLTTPMHNEP